MLVRSLVKTFAILAIIFLALLGLELGFGVELGLQDVMGRELSALDDAVSSVR